MKIIELFLDTAGDVLCNAFKIEQRVIEVIIERFYAVIEFCHVYSYFREIFSAMSEVTIFDK